LALTGLADLSKGFAMKTYNYFNLVASPRTGRSVSASSASTKTVSRISSYTSMLLAPMTVLACNVSDRSDITSIAILGYN